MASVLWGIALVAAVAWPARAIGPLDGAPFDTAIELIALAVVLPALWWFHPSFLKTTAARAIVALLLVWKVAAWFALPQGGWCADFLVKHRPETPGWGLTRSWDARTYAEPTPASCSAIMAAGYSRPLRLPGWSINLPYGFDRWLHNPLYTQHRAGDPLSLPEENPRPPSGDYRLIVSGEFAARDAGALALRIGNDVTLTGTVDGQSVSAAGGQAPRIELPAGAHRIDVQLDLSGRDWRFVPTWNDRDLFAATVTSVRPLTRLQRAAHRTGPWIAPLAILALLALWIRSAVAAYELRAATVAALAAVAAAMAVAGTMEANPSVARFGVVALFACLVIPLPERLRNHRGAWLFVGAPWLALIAALAVRQVGRFTMFEYGDDPLMYQRWAYRIYFEGYWLEGGQTTFWNQPLYRWICGALHLVFGDSSAGELVWDGFGLLAGSMFAFVVVNRMAGFRSGIAAAVAVLLTFCIGPNWYVIGRGLSEISALMWIYLAACCVIASTEGKPGLAILGGVFGILGYYTRMNLLPLTLGLGALTLVGTDAGSAFNLRRVWTCLPKRAFISYYAPVAAGLCAFAARTWYYTGRFSLFSGTSLGFNAIGLGSTLDSWVSADAWKRATASVLMLVTVQDPPRFDIRSVLVVAGVALSLLALVRVPLVRRLPLGLVLICLAAISGGLVVRGTAYPGRFSIHLIPVAVTVSMLVVSMSFRDALQWRRAS